jgi:PHS family inorganic phosphate transporter-like MFS transporter
MSAAIVSERGHLHRRGALLGWIFSNQGWGTLAGSICTIIILACFSKALNGGAYGQLDAVWRIQMGLALVPALIVLPFRLTMPEGKKYLESQELNYSNSPFTPSLANRRQGQSGPMDPSVVTAAVTGVPAIEQPESRKAKWNAFVVYFSEWCHLKVLLGTASTWFLLDVAFYGTNLNQSIILSQIGFSSGSNEYQILMRNAIGNLIVAVAGYVPGYFVTIALIELLGRKWIQIQGFLICALLFGVLAGDFNRMNTAGRFVCFALAQVS